MNVCLLDLLVREHCLSAKQAAELNELSDDSIVEQLISRRIMDAHNLAHLLAKLFYLKKVTLHDFAYQALCQQLSLQDLIVRYQAIPIERSASQLTLAVFDPSKEELIREFRFASGLNIQLVVCEVEEIKQAVDSLYGRNNAAINQNHQPLADADLEQLVQLSSEELSQSQEVSQEHAPISRYIHQVLLDAINKGASDIHFEPYEDTFRIRFRCDGLLLEAHTPPVQLARRLSTRVKILANLDIAERRLPQDGRAKLKLTNGHSIDMRVATLPTLWGEKVVVRLLESGATQLAIEQLGFNSQQSLLYQNTLKKPQGLILVTGPTGSGKTVSLYAGLGYINAPHINIATAEDPIEINIPGINQVQVQPKIDFTFAQALRAFLRQDPDVIMVGEIRDLETAEIAIRAAQTGHLVLSTLHTNSAVETLVRLQNMGIKPYNLAASLSLVIAQRLIRRLCPLCKQSALPSLTQRQRFTLREDAAIYQASSGCDHCNQGYLGVLAYLK
ncbi:type IV fimbrial assembly [Vibrio ponticus]|nr:type IV fimbrial assembly [Vibrio ponticus]